MNLLNRLKTLENKVKDGKKGLLYYIFNNGVLIKSNKDNFSQTQSEKATTVIIKRKGI